MQSTRLPPASFPSPQPSPPITGAREPNPRFSFLSHLAFAIVLAIVIARCLMLETIRDAAGTDPNAPPGPGAATSMVLDWLSFLPAVLLLTRHAVDHRFRVRFSLVHTLLTALAIWTLASVFWADDRFLALVSAARIAGGAALFWATSQIATRHAHLRVIVGVVVGLLLVNVVQGALYQNVELADLRDYWIKNKATVLQQHGWHEGDYVATRFEMKLLAGEMLNFSISANVLGALAVTAALAALGAALQRFEDKDDPGLIGALVICAASSAYVLAHTGSKASWAALGLGIALLGGWRVTRAWIARRSRTAFAVGLVTFALGILGVIAFGLAKGRLPSDSLNFRWRYWVGSWQLFLERPLTGIGWGNFADAYLRHRVPAAAEEIQDPHSFLVRWAVELGAVGLLLGVAWLIAWAWAATVQKSVASHGMPGGGEGLPSQSQISNLKSQDALTLALSRDIGRRDQNGPMKISRVLFACGLALVVTILCTIDFAGDANYAVLEIARRSMYLALIAIAIGLVCLGRRGSSDESFYVDERPAPWLTAGLFVGVLMLLVQSLIDITFFQPGPWVLVMAMMGTLAGVSWSAAVPAAASPRGAQFEVTPSMARRAAIRAAIAICVWVALAVPVVRVVWAESEAAAGDALLSHKQFDHALSQFNAASAISPVSNFDYALSGASAAMQAGQSARPKLDEALAAAPGHAQTWLTRSRYLAAPKDISAADADQSLADFGHAVSLNPNDVDLRIEYADLLERFGRRSAAADQLEMALRLDDELDRTEPERLELRSPGKYEEIHRRIESLRRGSRVR